LAWFFCGGEAGTSAGVVGSVDVSSAAEVRLGVERERRDMWNYELRRVLAEYCTKEETPKKEEGRINS